MKKLFVALFAIMSLVQVKAQDEEVTFTDEELNTYATVMVWAEQEKKRMGDSVEVWVKNNEKLSAAMYNELSRASKKGSIEEVEATDEEKAVFEQIQTDIDAQKESFKEVYVGKIKEDIGAGLYNKLKKALRTDDELKERYDAIYESLLAAVSDEEEVAEDVEEDVE